MCLKLQWQKSYLRFTVLVINFNDNPSWHQLLTFSEDVCYLKEKKNNLYYTEDYASNLFPRHTHGPIALKICSREDRWESLATT